MSYTATLLPKTNKDNSETGCCPRFDPKGWDEQTFVFDGGRFMKIITRSFMYMPIGMGKVMGAAMKQIEDVDARSDRFIMLSRDVSPWRCEHFIATNKDIPGAEMTNLPGMYLSKVFEGPYKNVGKWHEAMQEYAKSQNKKPIKTYFYYTTCPKCSKVFGKNYVVGFTQVED